MKKSIVKRAIIIALLGCAVIGTSGCASGPKFMAVENIPQGNALIYIYRPSTGLTGSGFEKEMYINHELVGKLGNNGYCYHMSSNSNVNDFNKTEM